jgi:high-affinity iron transporter
MLPSLLITLREGLEAALLLGLLLAVLARAGDTQDRRWVWLGVAAAVAASLAAGAALFATGAKLEGAAAAAFEAGAMVAAAAVLAGMIVWMGRRAHALRGELGGKVAAAAGSAAALFWLGFVLVVREGLETGLFLFAAVGEDRSLAALAGGLAGIVVAAGLGYAVYRGGSRLNVRVFFTVLNVVLLGFGTYLVLRGVGELGELTAGGEAGELAGPPAAGLYAGLMIWVLLRERRGARSAAGSGRPRPTGVAGRAPAGSSSRR